MFSKSNLESQCNRTFYQSGLDMFHLGYVSQLSYLESEDISGLVIVRAKVRGSGSIVYEVKLQIDEEMGIIDDYSCTCPIYYSGDHMCKHCVASALAYIRKRDRLAGSVDENGDTAPVHAAEFPGISNRSIYPVRRSPLIQFYEKQTRLSLTQSRLREKIELIPELTVYYGKIFVNFKIGAEKKYVLKSIPDFVSAVETSREVAYGQKLSFYHTMECFTPFARRLVRFLQAECGERQGAQRYAGYYISYGGFEKDRRVLSIDEANMDDFMEAVRGIDLQVSFPERGQGNKTSIWRLEEYEEEACGMALSIKGFSGGAVLKGVIPYVFSGIRHFYLWMDNRIYRVGREQHEELLNFYKNVGTSGEINMTIVSEELPIFCREILPLLEKNFDLTREEFQAEQYLPPKPEFEIYLDSPQRDMITCRLFAVYGENKYNVYASMSGRAMRDEVSEIRTGQQVAEYFDAYDEKAHMMVLADQEDRLYEFLTVSIEELRGLAQVYISDAIHSMQVYAAPRVTVGISLSGDLLEFTMEPGNVQSGVMEPAGTESGAGKGDAQGTDSAGGNSRIAGMPFTREQLAEILSRYDRKRKYFRFKDGMFVTMEGSDLETLSRVRETLQLTEEELKSGRILLPKFRALYLDSELKENIGLHAAKDKNFKALIRSMKTIEDNDFELPDSLKDVLREYQKQGFLWIKTLRSNGFGGILADEMGLGKTLQVIAFLLSELEEGEERESLIVCPASLVYNWKAEIERFAPALDAEMVVGNAAERRELIGKERTGRVLITSYDLLKRDSDAYEKKRFATQIIDEAQYIKNHVTHAAKSVKSVNAGFKLALTGTPIENRLSELWSIFDYLMPGFLYGYQRFRTELESPIVQKNDEDVTNRLRKMITPFILRRLKRDVLKDLPDKLEENMVTKLTGEQEVLYTAHVQRIRMMLENKTEEEFNAGKLQILAELTKLRQICCDPALLFEGYAGEAAKIELCMDILKNALDGGHKVLIFSQFTTMLAILQDRLRKSGIAYYSLTGSVPKESRAKMVEAFNKDHVPVFCISLKAGGTGLNLTAADVVIHYDPWWNVSVQNQATDRAHRIGQKNIVNVYKLIAKDTIEEKIVKLQEKKSALAEEMLGGEEIKAATFSREELLELLE